MQRFKKVILTLLALLSLGGCKASSEWMRDTGRIKVLSTTSQVGDLVREIGKERIDSWVLIQNDLDPHSYEIVKGDGEKLQRADLIFYNGLGLEHGASLSAFLQRSPKAVAIGEEIRKRHPERILQRGQIVDPHIWMDVSLWQEGIEPIVEALSAGDPEGAALYRERGDLLRKKMEGAHREIRVLLQKIPKEKRYLVTSHDAFQYFAKSYLAEPGESDWERRFRAPEGLAPEGQLNPREIQKIIAHLKAYQIGVVFPESNVSRDSIRKIASAGREMGVEIRICQEPLYGDAMGSLDYFEMMRKNAETVSRYL